MATTPADIAVGDNLVTATGNFVRDGQQQMAADIHLAVNFAVTDSNPNRPLGQAPTLEAGIYNLPWLRGYGNVKSLPIACQEDPALKQAVADLAGSGWLGALRNFEGLFVQWTGLAQAHAAHGVTRTNLTTEDKAWVLEILTGQDVRKSAIEAADFGTIEAGANRLRNTGRVYGNWCPSNSTLGARPAHAANYNYRLDAS